MNDILDQNKNFPTSSFLLKPALTISGKVIVVIDSELVQKLQLDGENTWFHEELKDNGIFLRVYRIKAEPSRNEQY